MDAQNAAQSDQTRPAGDEPRRPDPKPETTKSTPPPVSPKPSEPVDKDKDKEPRQPVNSSSVPDANASEDRDSDAETIVLPGKDGHSPSKARKVRQEDKSDGDAEGDASKSTIQAAGCPPHDLEKHQSSIIARGDPIKKKRLSAHLEREKQSRGKDAASSGLSSAPASPPQHRRQHRRRSDDPHSSSDSEHSRPRPSKTSLREKLKSAERLVPHKRKGSRLESDDEADSRKVRRQRTTSVGIDSGRLHREHKALSGKSHHESQNRSISPQSRSHRRSASSQLPSHSSNGSGQKKRRLPPPLHSTEYHSDESSASGSPHPRSSKLRSLATPATADTNASPARMAPHKKHLDAHGQTFLARACAKGDYEGAKTRLLERPEDLNVADYAGNTPLQIAAINGCEDIVKLLIEAGCNLDCVNYDKDTPLLDAVDNGHLQVVKLLLDAGVNPRKANVNGEEPVDRVSEKTENADEIRAALMAARKRVGERRRTSEDRHSHHDSHDARDSHAPDSPRNSPATNQQGRRSGTVRAQKTRNDLLYMPLDEKTLRQAAGRGDEETVARILQVKEGFNDPESMVAAARGGHDLVIQLLLSLGAANPDPAPISSVQPEFATPILAAIGQENIKVVELLLEQQGFDPTRRFKGETYYEIARRRAGSNWKEEEHMLKNAYDEHKRSHKDSAKTKSPNRRDRERERGEREEREAKRARRAEAKEKEEARLQQKRHLSSPEPKKKLSSAKLTSPKEKRRTDAPANHGDDHPPKRGPGRPRKEDRLPSINVSDRELSPSISHKQLKVKRAESDAAGVSSEGETVKPRRKLVSKGELRGERERQRRASMASNASSLKDHPTSPHETRHDEPSDKHRPEKLSEKYHDRTKALKRDESRDRLSVSGDGSTKRHRASTTPDRPSNGDKDDSEVPLKRRRIDGETKEKRPKQLQSSDERPRKSSSLQDSSKLSSKSNHKKHDDDRRERHHDSHRAEPDRSSSAEKLIHVKSEDADVDMKDADTIRAVSEAEMQAARAKEAKQAKQAQEAEQEKQRLAELEEAKKKEETRKKEEARKEEARKKEEERKRVEAEEKKKREEEEARKRAEEEEQKRKEEEAEQERRRKQEEEREAERKRKEEERRRREEEEKQRREAEEKARREEEEKKRLEEERKKKEEEERKQREEEERLHREQLEREAAEQARREREEEERKEKERRDRAHREEMEKKRAAREAEQRRIREEQERARLDKLPPLLRWLDTCPNPKLATLAEKFKRMQGCRYDTIRPEANQTPEGREQWVLNTHVALLLGEKDLNLSRYTAWERVPVSSLAKLTLWRIEWSLYSLVDEKLWDLGRQLPNYYGDEDPSELRFQTKQRLKQEAWERFLDMEMFFVKVSDLMYTVPNIPHLCHVQLAVEYRELLETEAQSRGWVTNNKWKQDPDAGRFHGFAPRSKYYYSGLLVDEDMPQLAQTSSTPFPEKKVPRRGLIQVHPDDPEYPRLCVEQGLEHLVNGHLSPPLANGIHSSPISQKSMNGTIRVLTPGSSEGMTNSTTTHEGLTNGVNGN
ncbi:hypothetical protein CDV36_013882 [Fusarium kuroshium]|uniref:Uncharacterized protein n=1 Tax=Fusarium kuroshium TaxID=2010991 RepID=A0A3M2RMK6_9HYPO|nr:hypothetical protein CDV36_013882 [Fusarium kuroshium]